MNTRNQAIEEVLIHHADLIMRDVQFRLTGPYIDQVVKAEWPKESDCRLISKEKLIIPPGQEVGYETRTYSLRKSAIHSPSICLEDVRIAKHAEKLMRTVQLSFTENLKWTWKHTFRHDIINAIETRGIAHPSKFNGPFLADPLPRRVNFFGKEVPIYKSSQNYKKWQINPKYKRAATQYVEFHPDIVHFLFPNPDKWAGEMAWKNILDREYNPDGCIGFYRVLLTYAAKPVNTKLGRVTTVPPPGFIGTLWYWAWKLARFVP